MRPYISRFFFGLFLLAQPILLSTFVVKHENAFGYFGLAGLLFIPLVYWIVILCCGSLKCRLSAVWFWYSFALVILMGVIFGRSVIKHNKLREHEIASCLCASKVTNATTTEDSFFDSKFLKITLCFTPGLMLLLLTSVTDDSGILEQLYFTTVMDLFDGIEMIEVLHEDVCDKIPVGWEIAVLIAALLFFLTSFLELHQVKFDEDDNDEAKERKTTAEVNLGFQIVLNLAFLVIRLVLWFRYDFDSAIFLAKNVISLVIAIDAAVERS